MRSITTKNKLGYSIVIAIIFSLWWGIPTYRKWKADRLVDELCAKDGRGMVYEAVALSKDKFRNGFVQIHIPQRDYVKPSDEYYYTDETSWIINENNSFGGLDLYRLHYKLFRVKDNKLMSEYVSYSRRGGDSIGPWHPSSYSCTDKEDTNIYPKTFVHK